MELQRKEWDMSKDYPTRSHHYFSGVPYHHHVGHDYAADRMGSDFDEKLELEKVV
jgi:hypothetical protein